MPSSADLVVRVLADTSSANASFSSMSGTIAKALGLGAAGAGALAVTQAAVEYQSSMAKIEAAYNNVDFTPGSAKYTAAKDQMMKDSVSLATSFKDVADVQSQAARFVDDFGNKLPTNKVDEYVQTMIRLSKVSTDNLAATDIGQRVDVFEKMYGQQLTDQGKDPQNFAAVGAAISAESGIHNQGEAPMLDTAIAIAQYGASMGVSQAQALGIGNYLTDLKAGGQQGGASIGRMLMRMDTSADAVLDPETKYADIKKNRAAQERLDDLQTSLKEAEAKQSEMYGQHGLKTAYRKNPELVMAEDDRIAKLKRDIVDQQENILHENDPNRSRPRGQMRVDEMAKTAGQDATAFATLFKDNPMEALLAFTRGLHELPESMRSAAETRAGIVNVRDQKTINTLADRPDVAASYVQLAQDQLDKPTDLISRSDIALGTTRAKEQDTVNMIQGGAAIVGEPGRAALDAGLSTMLAGVQANGFKPLEDALNNLGTHMDKFDTGLGILNVGMGALAPVMAFFGAASPGILAKLMGGAAQAGVAGASSTGATATGASSAAAGGGAASTVFGAGGTAAAVLAVPALVTGLTLAYKDKVDAMHGESHDLMAGLSPKDELQMAKALESRGYKDVPDAPGLLRQIMNEQHITQPPVQVTVGNINAGSALEDVLAAVTSRISQAWNAAAKGTPVAGAMGGNFSTSNLSPR